MIKRAELIRLEQGQDGTFGVMRLDGRVFCVTLEPPDKGNQADISCIPTGEYVCRRVESPRFGETYEITGVPGRTHILLHPGNVTDDTRGCVLLGKHFGKLRGDRAVLNSGRTFDGFMARCSETRTFPLVVEDASQEGPWKTSV